MPFYREVALASTLRAQKVTNCVTLPSLSSGCSASLSVSAGGPGCVNDACAGNYAFV